MHEVTWLIRSCDLVVLGPELLLRTPYRLSSSLMCSRNFCSSFAFFGISASETFASFACPQSVCVLVCLSYSECECDCIFLRSHKWWMLSSMTGSEAEAAGRETEAVRTRGRREEEDWHWGGAVPGRETQSGHWESKTAAVLSDRPCQETSCECLWYVTAIYNIFEAGCF